MGKRADKKLFDSCTELSALDNRKAGPNRLSHTNHIKCCFCQNKKNAHRGSLEKERRLMSKQYPECPLANHSNYRELHSPKFCAIIRKDKACLRKIPKQQKPKSKKF
jgi:hypothetical protein